MTLEELIQYLASHAKYQQSYGDRLFIIEKRVGDVIAADAVTKSAIIKMVRKMRNDMLLWCDDIISFANEDDAPSE